MPPDPEGPPPDLDTTGKHLYRTLREALRQMPEPLRWKPTDKHVLGQTCRYEMRARVARGALPKEGGKPVLTTEGSKGSLVVHPDLKSAEAAEKSFVEGLRELGFTPAQRKRLEIQIVKAGGGKFDL